jgi:hypothetical protein
MNFREHILTTYYPSKEQAAKLTPIPNWPRPPKPDAGEQSLH